MFLLDTNVVPELRKVRAGRADPNVARWAEQVEAETLFLSAITIMELGVGVMRIERRDPAQGSVLRNWLENYVLPEFSKRVLSVDLAVARRCAHLHVPDPGPERDNLIAATGLVHCMKLLCASVLLRSNCQLFSDTRTLLHPRKPG
uniref:type II toxin-antitoxin system VapC family toxin n=1 Tax=Gluconobacter oxydans TaxID=442 RepID=UPI0009BE91B0|nr:type II toxin-antitoxin system VapC family toxin [Gluconobacter oxydans]